MKLWKKNGKLIVDENKQPILCDECPCDKQKYGYIMCSGFYQQPRLINANNYIQGAMSGTWYMYADYNGSTYNGYTYCDYIISGVYQSFNNTGSERNGNWGYCPDYIGLSSFYRQGNGQYLPAGGVIAWFKAQDKEVWQINMPYAITGWKSNVYLDQGDSYYLIFGCGGNNGIRYNYVGSYPPNQYDYKIISGTCQYNNEQEWNNWLSSYPDYYFLCLQNKNWDPNILNFVIDRKQFELPLYDQNQNVISPSGICRLEYHVDGVTVTSDGWRNGLGAWKIEDGGQIKGSVYVEMIPPKQN